MRYTFRLYRKNHPGDIFYQQLYTYNQLYHKRKTVVKSNKTAPLWKNKGEQVAYYLI